MSTEYIKVVIIDDNIPAIEILETELKKYPNFKVISKAYAGEDGEEVLLKYKPDLLFLDIELPDMLGLDFYDMILPKLTWRMTTIFYSSHEKYAVSAVRLQAFDYLLKPLNKKDLSRAISNFLANRERRNLLQIDEPIIGNKTLSVTTITNDRRIIKIDNVSYFRYISERRLWEIVLIDSITIQLRSTTNAQAILNSRSEFVQIHKSYIINSDYLHAIKDGMCIIHLPSGSKEELKIGKSYKGKLLDKFYNL